MRPTLGFTLLELLIVVTIIGILSVLAAPVYQHFMALEQRNQAISELYLIVNSIDEYQLNHHQYPDNIDELIWKKPQQLSFRFSLSLVQQQGQSGVQILAEALPDQANADPDCIQLQLMLTPTVVMTNVDPSTLCQ
ncbi:type IV pilin protein [Celerinatantimonas sp. YJH-8]|uniref:type IV pilin protein n=1 Tax=Celerinatantimonas sp. YJH-8 TaxID=3228714 RepID=UPI0038CA1AFC